MIMAIHINFHISHIKDSFIIDDIAYPTNLDI